MINESDRIRLLEIISDTYEKIGYKIDSYSYEELLRLFDENVYSIKYLCQKLMYIDPFLYLLLKKEGKPIFIRDFITSGCTKNRFYEMLKRIGNLEIFNNKSEINLEEIFNRYAIFCNLSDNIKSDSFYLLKDSIEKGLNIRGKDAILYIASSIYLTLKRNNYKVTQDGIAKIFNTTPITIRRKNKEINRFL